jgi:hypothetical protein
MNKDTINLISYVIVYYPKDLAKMLNDNGVVVEDASNFSTKQLSDATVSGLTTSKNFNNDFVNYVKNINTNSNFTGSDGFFNISGGWADVLSSGIPSITKLFTLNTDSKNLQAQLDSQNLSNATQLEIERERTKQAQLNAQAGLNKVSAGQGGNTTLYIALGIGGALVLGLVIFLVTRKKG